MTCLCAHRSRPSSSDSSSISLSLSFSFPFLSSSMLLYPVACRRVFLSPSVIPILNALFVVLPFTPISSLFSSLSALHLLSFTTLLFFFISLTYGPLSDVRVLFQSFVVFVKIVSVKLSSEILDRVHELDLTIRHMLDFEKTVSCELCAERFPACSAHVELISFIFLFTLFFKSWRINIVSDWYDENSIWVLSLI